VSARPDVPRLSEEELDLLISRSLDGDLSPEEEQKLERIVSLDPAAGRRREELAALVADVKRLPEPAPPFALATRVNSNVAERAGRRGSLTGRLGFFPAPGSAKAALIVLFLLGVAIAILRPNPRPAAEGPVDVLLYDARPAAPAQAPASTIAEAQAPQRGLAPREEKQEVAQNARRQDGNELKKSAPEAEKKALAGAPVAEPRDAESLRAAASSGKLMDETRSKEKANVRERTELDQGAASAAPAKVAGALEAQAPAVHSAPAAPPAARAASLSAPGWTVAVRGAAARRWSLRRAPDAWPANVARRPVVFRVAVDAGGRVASAEPVGGAVEPALASFVRGMTFEPLPEAAAAGGKRDAKDAPAAPAEFEIELSPR
jgi:hypothetical protein